MKYTEENLLWFVCVFQDVPCGEASKHQPGVPDHRCQGNMLVLWPQATQTGRTTMYPLTCAVKSEHRVTFPFHFPALHPSLNNSGPLNPQHKDTHLGVCNRSPEIVHRWTVNQVHSIWKPFSYYLRIRAAFVWAAMRLTGVLLQYAIKADEKLLHKNQTEPKSNKFTSGGCSYVAISDLGFFSVARSSCGSNCGIGACPNPALPLTTTAHVQTQHFLNGEDWFKCLLKYIYI